jgi:hypothetical protein
LISSTGSSFIIPLSADFTTANIADNQLYKTLTSGLPLTTIKKISYMTADPAGYDDDQNLYNLSMDLGFQLVCPVRRYKNTPPLIDRNWLTSMNLH